MEPKNYHLKIKVHSRNLLKVQSLRKSTSSSFIKRMDLRDEIAENLQNIYEKDRAAHIKKKGFQICHHQNFKISEKQNRHKEKHLKFSSLCCSCY